MTTQADTTAPPARDGAGRFSRTVDSAERDAEALHLRARNWTLQAISDHLGYGSRANVHHALRRALDGVVTPAAAELRTIQDAQLDELAARAQAVLDARHLVFWQGRPVRLCAEHPDACTQACGEVVDDAPVLRAIECLLRIMERRARLWGLDAPVRAQVEASGTVRYEIVGVDTEALS